MTGSATIAEIAREAGVSVATVSKVLNGRSDVAGTTRARVEEALQRHSYRPRNRTRSADGSRTLELAFPELDSPWAVEVLRGVERETRTAGVVLSVAAPPGRDDPGRQAWLEQVLGRRPVGVLLVLSDLTERQYRQLDSRGIPYAVVDPVGDAAREVPSVGAGNWAGGLEATAHLAALGHRRIAAIGGPVDVLCSRARLDGHRTALDRAGLEADPALLRHGDFHVAGGERAAEALLDLPDPPTAVFAGSDLQAVGVYRAAHRRGLRIPHDLSVVGFDDLPLCEWLQPALTTVRQPLEEMAALAARTVLRMAAGEARPAAGVDLATSFVLRESTAPPGGAG